MHVFRVGNRFLRTRPPGGGVVVPMPEIDAEQGHLDVARWTPRFQFHASRSAIAQRFLHRQNHAMCRWPCCLAISSSQPRQLHAG
ncbi:hypothetical protein V6N13_022092 [Hibiscus sabdariffa]|uniref:Uncharacterized protein n=2 Tax=Hibiscus sabdariffa TaxID=183260 RepID=A0ABR2CQL6_9ROSI